MSGILEDSGLARRTLYLNFPAGKPELVAAATLVASEETVSAFEQALHSESDPVHLVENFIERSAKALESNDFAAGCPIAAAALGRDEAPAAADAAGAAFAGWVSTLTRIATESGIADGQTAEEFATMIVATVEGALIMSIAERSAEPLRRSGRVLAAMIQAKLDH